MHPRRPTLSERLRRWRKRIALILAIAVPVLCLLFLHFIPPIDLMPPEMFIDAYLKGPPDLSRIEDPTERALAERGRYLVLYSGCSNCHTWGSYTRDYMGGGVRFGWRGYGTVVSSNLTSHPKIGLGRYSDEEVLRMLRSGTTPSGRIMDHYFMPWAVTANLTEEDRYAILVYLRQVPPVARVNPDWRPEAEVPYKVGWSGLHGRELEDSSSRPESDETTE